MFLAVTGGEALYADMGHFGRAPISRAWFRLVLPALTLNYFGQGALLLSDPAAIQNPFYLLAPSWLLAPLVVLATAATIIASQAVISGVFSVASQALNLGYLPRIRILQSSATAIGQIYVPSVNWILLLGTALLVVGFGSSEALAERVRHRCVGDDVAGGLDALSCSPTFSSASIGSSMLDVAGRHHASSTSHSSARTACAWSRAAGFPS